MTDSHINNKRIAKLVYRLFDFLLVRSSFPLIGKLANSIRVFFARRISKAISKKAFIEKGAIIGNKITVDDYGCIGRNCLITPMVSIGEHTMMGPDVLFFTMQHKKSIEDSKFVSGYEDVRPITIGKHCWIGQRAIILGGVHIGDFVTIGAGAVVTKDVPSNCMVAGNPAVIKKRYE